MSTNNGVPVVQYAEDYQNKVAPTLDSETKQLLDGTISRLGFLNGLVEQNTGKSK